MNSKSNTELYEKSILKCKIGLAITHGILIPVLSYFAFWFFDVDSIVSFGLLLNILTILFLMGISIFPKAILGTGISEMKENVAMHYQSFITNMTIGFSSVIGIGIAVIWSQPAIDYRIMVTRSLIFITVYFILVMYFRFFLPLNLIINDKSNNG